MIVSDRISRRAPAALAPAYEVFAIFVNRGQRPAANLSTACQDQIEWQAPG